MSTPLIDVSGRSLPTSKPPPIPSDGRPVGDISGWWLLLPVGILAYGVVAVILLALKLAGVLR